MEQYSYLGTNLTNKDSFQEEIKGRMKSGKACYYPVQNPLSFSWLSKNINHKIYRTIILHVFCVGLELGRSLREEGRLRVFENRLLRKIFGPKREEVIGD